MVVGCTAVYHTAFGVKIPWDGRHSSFQNKVPDEIFRIGWAEQFRLWRSARSANAFNSRRRSYLSAHFLFIPIHSSAQFLCNSCFASNEEERACRPPPRPSPPSLLIILLVSLSSSGGPHGLKVEGAGFPDLDGRYYRARTADGVPCYAQRDRTELTRGPEDSYGLVVSV